MYIKETELNALSATIDFLAANSDGADDAEYYSNLKSELYNFLEKSVKQFKYQEYRKYLKKYLNEGISKRNASEADEV